MKMAEKLSKQVTVGIDPYTGKRIRKRVYATSKTGLEQAVKEAVAAYARNETVRSVKYGKYLDQWLEAYCGNLEAHTQRCYRSLLNNTNVLREKKMDKITRLDLQKVINGKWEHPTTCKKLLSLLRQIWASAVIDGVVGKNITDGIKRPKMHKSDRRALTERELAAIRSVKLPEMERFFLDTMLQFGLRPGECLALNVRSFDRKRRTLTIDKAVAYNAQTPYIKGTKTGVTRVLPVPDSFWEKIPKIDRLYFFANRSGQLYTRGGSSNLCRRICDAINREMGGTDAIRATDMTMYTLRHNKASMLYYMQGISLKKKAEYMGHSEAMFLQTYSHMIEANEDAEILRQAVI